MNDQFSDEEEELQPFCVKSEDGSEVSVEQFSNHSTQQKPPCQNERNIVYGAYQCESLYSLLKDWKLEKLYRHFEAEKITIEVLKIMKMHHIEKVLGNFDMGTQILFEHHLEKWRESIGRPLHITNGYKQSMTYPKDTFFPIESVPEPQISTTRSSPYARPSDTSLQYAKTANLTDILIGTKKGKLLIDYYNEHNEFREDHRSTLIKAIAQYFIENDLTLPLSTSYKLEQEIVDRFPSEKLEYYRTAKRGRIYNKYSNIKCTEKFWKKSVKKPRKEEKNKRPTQQSIVSQQDVEIMKHSIMYDILSTEQFDHLWKGCFEARFKDINESTSLDDIFEKWPHYKKSEGTRLIDMDFKLKYKTNFSFLDAWTNVRGHIHEFLKTDGVLNNKSIRAEIDFLLHGNLNDNSFDAILMWALHGYLVPWQRVVKKNTDGKNIVKRFTIADSQESFIVTCKSNDELDNLLRGKKIEMENTQPFIVTVGESLRDVNDIYVFFDDTKIAFPSVTRAVDICSKIYLLFNLQFPKPSTTFWNFVQLFFYNIKSDESFSKVNVIINELKKKQETSQ